MSLTLQDVSKTEGETEARRQLACAYRLFDHFGWHELIYNHITVRVPGNDEHFLINPFGLMYREVKASNLVKIDVDGTVVGSADHSVNPAGFVVHSAIHRARPDMHAVAHTHTTAGQAVACQKQGLLPLSFTSMFYTDQVAYHDFEGITLDTDECARLTADLGSRRVMILRNHGLLVCGETIAETFMDLYHLQRACEVQVAASAGGAELNFAGPEVAAHCAEQHARARSRGKEGKMLFDAMMRWMKEKDSSFLD
ncbi:class II aldolase/adducin family protein [Paraburkholderia sediminicola]|uniref:class II aldolase/adducin family protein n=1 Tax=Paraburkholderia sediminicola TaxID=458836 RepID=UPI0038BDFCB9